MSEDFKDLSWTPQLESYLSSQGEKAHCLAYCHKKAEEKFARLRTFIDLPVIALSSICGFLQVGAESMFKDPQASAIGLGVLSLFTALLASVQSYYRLAARAENHRLVAIQWSRLYRLLALELNLPRDERKEASQLVRDCKESVDRLQEISPLIPPDIISDFKKNFDKYKDISKPEEANGLEKITVYNENPMRKIESFLSNGTPSLSNPSGKQTHGQAPEGLTIQLPTETPS